MSTEQFVAALTEYQLEPTEIADILWLVLQQTQPHEFQSPEIDDDNGPGGDDESDRDLPDVTEQINDDDVDQEDETPEDSPEEEPAFDLAPELPTGILPKNALPISVPDASMLDDTLPLVRALKPLLKQIESQTVSCVNEAETVDHIAETDIWTPILDPEKEPWFEVALVIDSNPGMSLWQRLIDDIQRLLRCYGSFRDFRVWQLSAEMGEVSLRSLPDLVPRSPKALLPPDGRRLILVFSDCTADYWWDGSIQPILSIWGESTPTAVWQVLPDWMWKRTALGVGEYVAIRNHLPGANNTNLNPIYLSLRASVESRRRSQSENDTSTGTSSICIPVITAEGQSLADWSRVLVGDRRCSTPGFLLPASGWPSAPSASVNQENESQPQEDLLDTFRLRSTPSARRLAALLSAAPVITLPVMRLIRASDEFLPGSSPLPVAEVFLGGLLKKAPDQPESASPELVQYTFPDEVRDRLLDILPKVDAIEVIEAVSQHVAEHLNCTLTDFRALLLSPDLKDEADRYGLRSFAKMTAQILKKVGEFDELVRQLESQSENQPSVSETVTEEDWLEGFTQKTLTYQVAEYINFPLLESFEFEEASLVEDELPPFPPPLEEETFTVVKLDAEPSLKLETFDIEVATLVKRSRWPRGEQWQIKTKKTTAQRYIERLPDDHPLEMIAIPGGTFLMGSPEDELGRLSRESPQHEVILSSFFLGRYPVTQAQWRSIAALPPIQQELEPDPSRFKGEMNPVERVSWRDAIEFCARLSAHTDREYRLPTEAEWEYACRARTQTPFNFGLTITTDLANYNGSAYADGPKGENRARTTPVNQFGYANTYGLSDIHGNVFEWCQDHWHDNYEGAPPIDGSAWLSKNDNAPRVRRGGSWVYPPRHCRSAYRDYYFPDDRYYIIGFRVGCSAPRSLS